MANSANNELNCSCFFCIKAKRTKFRRFENKPPLFSLEYVLLSQGFSRSFQKIEEFLFYQDETVFSPP